MLKFILPAAIAAASLALPAHAAEKAELKIAYGDLNLASAEGVKSLDSRINRAISQVCGDNFGVQQLGEQAAIRACRASWKAAAYAQRSAAIARTGGGAELSVNLH